MFSLVLIINKPCESKWWFYPFCHKSWASISFGFPWGVKNAIIRVYEDDRWSWHKCWQQRRINLQPNVVKRLVCPWVQAYNPNIAIEVGLQSRRMCRKDLPIWALLWSMRISMAIDRTNTKYGAVINYKKCHIYAIISKYLNLFVYYSILLCVWRRVLLIVCFRLNKVIKSWYITR